MKNLLYTVFCLFLFLLVARSRKTNHIVGTMICTSVRLQTLPDGITGEGLYQEVPSPMSPMSK